MPSTMPKRKPAGRSQQDAKSKQPPGRPSSESTLDKQLSVRLPLEWEEALEKYCQSRRPKVTKPAVIRLAIEDLLTSEGFQPGGPNNPLEPDQG